MSNSLSNTQITPILYFRIVENVPFRGDMTHDPSLHSRPKEFIIPAKIIPIPWNLIHLCAFNFVKEVDVSQPELCIFSARGEQLKASVCKMQKREMDEKVTSWVKLTRLGTANRQRHPSKPANTKTYVSAAILSPLSPFGRFYSVDSFSQFGWGTTTLVTQ